MLLVIFLGAGSAGVGVCTQIFDGMVEAGLSRSEARSRFALCTNKGVIGKGAYLVADRRVNVPHLNI